MTEDTIVSQIIGGLSLELRERFPHYSISLVNICEEPAVKVGNVWVVVDKDRLKVIIASDDNYRPQARYVLYSCSMARPTDDFEGLFEFLSKITIEDSEWVNPFKTQDQLRRDFSWIDARSVDNQSK
jgi:hypothetical protein